MADQNTYFEVYRESDGARFGLSGPEADNVFAEMQKTGFVRVDDVVTEAVAEAVTEPETPDEGEEEPVIPEAQGVPAFRVQFEPRQG
jgi:hypothetical protein